MLESGGAKPLGDDHRLERADIVGEVICCPVHDADFSISCRPRNGFSAG